MVESLSASPTTLLYFLAAWKPKSSSPRLPEVISSVGSAATASRARPARRPRALVQLPRRHGDGARAGYEVATYQQRGLAPSTTQGPFSVTQEQADVSAVLDLGWDRAWVVGHSWGGHLLLHLAAAHPEQLKGGLAVDTLGGVGDGGAGAMERTFDAWIAATSPNSSDTDDDGDSGDTESVSSRLQLVEGAGHFPWVEAPGCVRAALDQLVTEVSAT